MTNAISDYGSSLYTATITGSTVGSYSQLAELVKIKFGEVKVNTVDMTSHQSTNGYKELRPSGQKEIGEMELTANFISASSVNTWKTDMDNNTLKSYKIVYGTSASFIFTGFPVSI